MNVKHLGTDKNYATMQNLINALDEMGTELLAFYDCERVERCEDGYTLYYANGETIKAERVIIATGRGGANFVADFCRSHGVHMRSNHVDIGVRVEMKDMIWKEFSDKIYEPKILYKTKTFEDRCRMFCFNKGGLVSAQTVIPLQIPQKRPITATLQFFQAYALQSRLISLPNMPKAFRALLI